MDPGSASSVDYSSGEEVDEDYDVDGYSSPLIQSSQFFMASSHTKHEMNWTYCIFSNFLWLLLPTRLILSISFYFYNIFLGRGFKGPIFTPTPTPQRFETSHVYAVRKSLDHVVERATDRRRGVIEDIHLGMENCIESIFDGIHKIAACVLSPMDSFWALMKWSSMTDDSTAYVTTTILAEHNPIPTGRKTRLNNSSNTDARTCQDVITELGYPYEAINVVTADGYVLLLERIPRRDARKTVYLQHGVFDSSMGWVSNGFVGSPAFAAFDQGYDVFLGNFRGLVSREHVNKNISSQEYWRYSINEHGTEDIPAMIEKIHEVKTSELDTEETNTGQPYKLCAIGHSLGGAAILMYIITRRVEQKPHRLSRLILLSPAGFHHDSTICFKALECLLLWLAPVLQPLVPGLYIPTRFFRMLVNKLARDFQRYPAVGGVVQTLIGYLLGGDSSNWIGVMGCSTTGVLMANMRVYGLPEPLDLGEYYGLIDVPVDLVAGKRDKVVRPSMVRRHYCLMREAGVDASYSEFEYAHLDFVFSLHREELTGYVMSRLSLVAPAAKKKSLRLKRKDGEVVVKQR
ncbi:hypothetical protein SSX86_025480 [Deinandra increscens subsp. villosa]|uniref:Partial AB-hydrolase lipase domain-containing protein n=1 Tax=Deinandra increscens subsp. villosa TaxID=3103831 RepID=A0AAP0GN12_9ASTR